MPGLVFWMAFSPAIVSTSLIFILLRLAMSRLSVVDWPSVLPLRIMLFETHIQQQELHGHQ